MLLNDSQIADLALQGMITPFTPRLVRQVEVNGNGMSITRKVLSYGLSSYGYDLRLSPKEFLVFRHVPGTILDPKNFNPDNLEPVKLHSDANGDYFILPGHSYGLGVAMERLALPGDVTALFIGKSSMARCFTADTKVKLVDGDFTFADLIGKWGRGEKLYGYGVTDDNEIVVQELVEPRFIENSEIVRVHLDDGNFIDCTSDHQFILRDGSFVAAEKLTKNTSLMPIYQHHSHGYPTIWNSVKRSWKVVHLMVDDYRVRNGLLEERPKGIQVHHVDENINNNHPSNLVRISAAEHAILHNREKHEFMIQRVREYWGSPENKKNHLAILHSPETRAKAVASRIRFYATEQGKELCSKVAKKIWESGGEVRRKHQSEVAKNGMAAMRRRDDITPQTLSSALLETGSIRGAARLLNVDRSAFRRFPEVIQQFKEGVLCNNHKVVKVERMNVIQPTYCLAAPETGNFALSSGVFVKNCGIIANLTPGEAGWEGHLTLEFSNASHADARIYANEGIVQALFFRGEPCSTSYEDRQGKYQGQPEKVVFSKV